MRRAGGKIQGTAGSGTDDDPSNSGPQRELEDFCLRMWTTRASIVGRQPGSTNGGINAQVLTLRSMRKPAHPNNPPRIGMHENPTRVRQACAMPK